MSAKYFAYLKDRARREKTLLDRMDQEGEENKAEFLDAVEDRLPMFLLLKQLRKITDAVFDCTDLSKVFTGSPPDTLYKAPLKPPFPLSWFESKNPKCGPECRIGCLITDCGDHLDGQGSFFHSKGCHQFFQSTDKGNSVNEFFPTKISIPLDVKTFLPDFDNHKMFICREAVPKDVDPDDPETLENIASLTRHVTLLPFFCIGLLNCKNVAQVQNPVSPKIQKARERRGKYPLFNFRTLKITGTRGAPNTPLGGTAASPSLHVQRGHFKDFNEKPLFGRHKGTFWWQPHARGSPDSGVVRKDYDVGV